MLQITDNIHETVYLSCFESEMISTPYFYRLHDVYQSSTVYMTYPSNRTKRYEHSIGCMEIASSMLFSAITNVENEVQNEIFGELKKTFSSFINTFCSGYHKLSVTYITKSKSNLDNILSTISKYNSGGATEQKLLECVKIAISIKDAALDQFQYYPFNICEKNPNGNMTNSECWFLYRCILEALRIAALFHDVGHPPFSHIIEEVLNELYKKCIDENNPYNKKKCKKLVENLENFCSIEKENAYAPNMILCNDYCNEHSATHERIGLSLLQAVIDDVVPAKIESLVSDNSKKAEEKIVLFLFYALSCEFAVAILTNKNHLFHSFHSIIDGIVDSDRLDYVMRDMHNAGVDWGRIPYKRIIKHSKFELLDNTDFFVGEFEKNFYKEDDTKAFVITFPKKVVTDIEDFIVARYKVFARINFHHRVKKTAVALQDCVRTIAEDYLKKPKDEDCINPNIVLLWNALSFAYGDKNLRIIQWNDSWLITVLSKTLVSIDDKRSNNYTRLRKDLEEILLNKKNYCSVEKHGDDNKRLFDSIIENSKITMNMLDNQKEHEQKNIKKESTESMKNQNEDILKDSENCAEDSLKRIDIIKRAIMTSDLQLLDTIIPFYNEGLPQLIENVLKKNDKIADYKVYINTQRDKMGLPGQKNDCFQNIYVQKSKGAVKYDCTLLKEKLETIRQYVPLIYVYIEPKSSDVDLKSLTKNIEEQIAKKAGSDLEKRYKELFSSNATINKGS